MSRMALGELHKLVWTALLAATIAAGAHLIVPIGPVPVSMQPLFIALAGFVLGPRRGVACMLLYLAAGFAGLPVFAGGNAGLGVLMGPTAGYLAGYVVLALFTGLATGGQGGQLSFTRGVLAGVAGMIVVYACGLLWLVYSLDMEPGRAMVVGVYPFALWDLIKMVFAVACYRILVRYSIVR
ncbi:MAG: biotin transporter BioY [Desulfovibrio sp.]